MKIVGKVLWWDSRDKEGVIVDPSGVEFYFNHSVLMESPKVKTLEGKFVQFEKHKRVNHINCAYRVSVVPTNSQTKVKRAFKRK